MLIKVLIISALVGGATIAPGASQEHKIPVGLQLRIILLNNLAYVQAGMLAAFTKFTASQPAVHDQVTAAVVSAIRKKSEQSEADFAASIGVSVEVLQRTEQEGTGLDRAVLEQIWGMGLLSVKELVALRRDVMVATMSEEDKAVLLGRASKVVQQLLTVLKYIQVSSRSADSVQLPAVEDILRQVRDDYGVLIQLAAEHYPQIKEFISLESLSDELITGIATASAVTDKLRHHIAFTFFLKQISNWSDEQAADQADNE